MKGAAVPNIWVFAEPPLWLRNLLRISLRLTRWHKLLPTTRWGDALYAHLLCLLYNGHWPQPRGGGFNSFMAYLKCSWEIETPLRRLLSDKESTKHLVTERLGPGWCVPTLGVLERPEEVSSFEFTYPCVVKPTHASGEILFVDSEEQLDRRRIAGWFRFDHYRRGRERNYHGIKPRVLVEPMLDMQQTQEFWFFCLRGEPSEFMQFSRSHLGGLGPSEMVSRYRLIDGQADGSDPWLTGPDQPPPPENLADMVQASRRLSQGMVFARVDFYRSDQRLWVGEVTHISANGLFQMDPVLAHRMDCEFFGPEGFVLEQFPELLQGPGWSNEKE